MTLKELDETKQPQKRLSSLFTLFLLHLTNEYKVKPHCIIVRIEMS